MCRFIVINSVLNPKTYLSQGVHVQLLNSQLMYFTSKSFKRRLIFDTISFLKAGSGFNRDAWEHLEKYSRHLTKLYKNVYVITGPLFLPK